MNEYDIIDQAIINTKTGKVFTEYMSMSEREDYLKNNPHIKQLINSIN